MTTSPDLRWSPSDAGCACSANEPPNGLTRHEASRRAAHAVHYDRETGLAKAERRCDWCCRTREGPLKEKALMTRFPAVGIMRFAADFA